MTDDSSTQRHTDYKHTDKQTELGSDFIVRPIARNKLKCQTSLTYIAQSETSETGAGHTQLASCNTHVAPNRRTDNIRWHYASCPEMYTRGRVRAGPNLQLGTLSTRIANLLCIIHSALSRLSCRAAAVLRVAHVLGPGGPLPHATPIYS